jgi:hypothetical protein
MSRVEASLPYDPVGFTEPERLTNRLSHGRLLALLADEQTYVHTIEPSENTYGEFLFILTSRATGVGELRAYSSFWGLGYDHQQERWLVEEWFWYDNDPDDATEIVEKTEVQQIIEKRQAEISPHVMETKPSLRENHVGVLADLSAVRSSYPQSQDLEDGERRLAERPIMEAIGNVSIVLQYTLFTGELVDNRTAAQKRQDEAHSQPTQIEMFSQRDLAQFGVTAHPQMALPPDTKLVLISEDPRTPEEMERDREQAAQALTIPLFEAPTPEPPQPVAAEPREMVHELRGIVGFRRFARSASARVRRRCA